MGSLSRAPPQAAQEDPAITAQRKAELQRAEDDRIKAIQGQLAQETQNNSQQFGIRSLLGGFSGGRRNLTSLLGAG